MKKVTKKQLGGRIFQELGLICPCCLREEHLSTFCQTCQVPRVKMEVVSISHNHQCECGKFSIGKTIFLMDENGAHHSAINQLRQYVSLEGDFLEKFFQLATQMAGFRS